MKKLIAAGLLVAGSLVAMPAVANAAPADGRCVAQGAGFTFDGPTKASVAKAGLMSFVIKDHAFNNADATEALLGISICE
jgi:hypothetical protein